MERLRAARRNGQDEGRKGTEQRNVETTEKQPSRTYGTDLNEVFENAARYMGVFDPELILSWEPHEYRRFIKGCQERQIDRFEEITMGAMANAKAQNSKKRIKAKDIFDAEKARRKLNGENTEEMERMTRLNDTFKGFKPDFRPKGG